MSSPLGVSYFQIKRNIMINKAGGKFPSPLRVSYFQMLANSLSMRDWHRFPSPLGVSYFQISKEFFFRNLFHNVFPSPLGVSYFQISLKVCKRCLLLLKKFPSPLGVSYFQINCLPYLKRNQYLHVSVPSRGILFPNRKEKTLREMKKKVSVPSRGILFPNQSFCHSLLL